jgi:EAL domain-containing protein (putative c-di-GMP-specific phosphodiesterase class I)
VAALDDMGIVVSIDDYGTGYSSLAYLRDLAVGELKLAREFVSILTEDDRAESIVRTTVDLAHSLGLRLVAEGIEDAATADSLTALGCDVAQGYRFCRPCPPDQLERWLEAGSPVGGPLLPAEALA